MHVCIQPTTLRVIHQGIYFSKPRVYLQRGSSPRITAAIHVAADINHHSYSSFVIIFRIHLSYSSFVLIFRIHISFAFFVSIFHNIFRIHLSYSYPSFAFISRIPPFTLHVSSSSQHRCCLCCLGQQRQAHVSPISHSHTPLLSTFAIPPPSLYSALFCRRSP